MFSVTRLPSGSSHFVQSLLGTEESIAIGEADRAHYVPKKQQGEVGASGIKVSPGDDGIGG